MYHAEIETYGVHFFIRRFHKIKNADFKTFGVHFFYSSFSQDEKNQSKIFKEKKITKKLLTKLFLI